MTNAEKYQKIIKKIINEGSLAVNEVTGDPFNCAATYGCGNCLFKKQADCDKAVVKWLVEDFKEKKYTYKLTPFEKELLERMKDKWSHISRDEALYITLHQSEKPTFYLEKYAFKLDRIIAHNGLFGFIEKGERLRITDILNDCEVLEDEDNN